MSSRDRAIRFVLHVVIDTPGRAWTPSEWRVRARYQSPGYGKPTVENIKKHCLFVEESTAEGGVNAHLGATKILKAWVVDQETGAKVAEYTRDA